MVFITSSLVVDRSRPPVSQLDSVPLTSSYPSGHTAAAVAFYGAIAIIVFWHTRNRIARGLALTAAILLPPIVGVSRMYRGMHHLSDVIVGAIVGLASLGVVYAVVRPRWRESMSGSESRDQAPATSTATMVHRSFTEPVAFTTTGDPSTVGASTRWVQ